MSQCTCTTDKEATCIVHPTTRSLKEYDEAIAGLMEAKFAELEAENRRLKADGVERQKYADKAHEESAERMHRRQKLVALCHEYGIPMEKVLDTGLREGE